MGKVLDITERIKTKDQDEVFGQVIHHGGGEHGVTDISETRQEMINKERREVKRTILTEFIGAFIVLPERGLLKVAIYDISENGMAFDTSVDQGTFSIGEEVAMRVYMNKKTYFPFSINVINSRQIDEDGIIRHGASLLKGGVNDVALNHFIKFIENVSASLRKDDGDVMVSNIS